MEITGVPLRDSGILTGGPGCKSRPAPAPERPPAPKPAGFPRPVLFPRGVFLKNSGDREILGWTGTGVTPVDP